jgi:hypothetical protein
MSRNILVPDAPVTESDTTEATDAEETQVAVNDEVVATDAPATPDKYAGKTMEEVIEMHMNAEKEIGRQANEVGTYRDLLKTMAEVQNVPASQTDTTEAVKPVEVSTDDLWDNPTEAIRNVVKETIHNEIAPIQQNQQEQVQAQQFAQLMHVHPDAEQIGADPKFQAFVEKSPYRMQDAQRWIETRDVDAANRLLSDYKETHGTTAVEGDVSAVNKARAVATETGKGSGGPKGKETMSKREVMKVFINDRDRYDSDAYQQKLLAHARRGTLVD